MKLTDFEDFIKTQDNCDDNLVGNNNNSKRTPSAISSSSFTEQEKIIEEIASELLQAKRENIDNLFHQHMAVDYIPAFHALGTKGMWQLSDRVQFVLESFHNQICCHPSLRNPDDNMNDIRGQTAFIAQQLFVLFSMMMEKQYHRPDSIN